MSSANSASAPKAVASEKPAPSTTSVDTSSSDAGGVAAPATSSSYANMLNPKAAGKQQTDKEPIMDKDAIKKSTKPKPATEEPAKLVSSIKEVKPQPEIVASTTSSAENTKQVDETGVEAEEDDPTFIPVVSQHIRKENKRRERPAAPPATKSRGVAHSTAPVKFAVAPPTGEKPTARRIERKERRGVDKETKVDKEGAAKPEVTGEPVSVKSVNEDDKEKEDGVKFVEAPIPVVNAWKLEKEVRIYHYYLIEYLHMYRITQTAYLKEKYLFFLQSQIDK